MKAFINSRLGVWTVTTATGVAFYYGILAGLPA